MVKAEKSRSHSYLLCSAVCLCTSAFFYSLIILYSISGLTQKNSFGYLNVIVFDIDVCYSTLSDLPGP